jgi:hypothetical protein
MIPIPYQLLTKQSPSVITDVLSVEEGDMSFAFFLDRSVPGGMNFQDAAVHYSVMSQHSEDGTVWSDNNGFTMYGGITLSGSGTADDPFYVTRYDGSVGNIIPGARFFRVVIDGYEISEGSPVGIFGFLSSSPSEDMSSGWPQ